MSNFKFKVYQLVKRIPKGKVTTYGQIASLIQNSKVKKQKYNLKFKISPRWIGWVLHQNKDPNVPCHRVVDRNGRIAKNFAFGGVKEQRKRLLAEEVKFVDDMHVDLKSSVYKEWKKNLEEFDGFEVGD